MKIGDLVYIPYYGAYGIIIGHGGWKGSWRVLGTEEFTDGVSITKVYHSDMEVVS